MLSLIAVLAKKVIKMIISLMNHCFIILMIFTDLFSAFRKLDITYDTDMILILHANYTMILQTLLFLHEMYTKAVKT